MNKIFKIDTSPLDESLFTATQFNSAADKAKFGLQFLKFVASDFPETIFTNAFYTRLHNTFGHIAYYNRAGFYQTHFSNFANKITFLKLTMDYPCYGKPEYTFCDVEAEIQKRLYKSDVCQDLLIRYNREVETRERAILSALTRKYGNPEPSI